MTAAGIDQGEIRRALGYYEGLPGRVSVMYLQEQGAVPAYASYATTAAELDQAMRDIVKADLVDEPLGVYLRGTTVADGVSGRGGSDDTVAWLSFRADLDLAKPGGPPTWSELFAAFERAELPTPTYWQHSGGGFYPTWMLAAPVPHGPDVEALAADIEAELRRAWQVAGYTSGVDSCHDAARVWRLAGSVHRKNRSAVITSTIGKFSGELLTAEQLRERTPRRERPAGWDGRRSDPRRATAEALERTYLASLADCRGRGRDYFRHTFFLAARNSHRMTAVGLRTPDAARAELLDLVQTFWPGMGLNGDDRRHIHDALNNGLDRGEHAGALASPWELVVPSNDEYFGGIKLREGSDVDGAELGEQLTPEEIERRAFERLVAERVRALDVDEEARRRKAQRNAAERPSILDGLIDANDLDDLPDPKMLLGEFIPEAGVGVLAGKFGSYKSFVTVSWACALAAGRPWLDKEEFDVPGPVKVLYVAAEGASGMKLRRRAWSKRFGDIPRGNLSFYPRAVNLTDAAAVEDLEKAVAAREFKVVFIDTLHRSAPGAEENSSTELGLVFEAACRLRDEYGVTVVFVDHTGHGGERPRGSSIKVDDSDFVIIADRPGEAATSDIQRTLKMHKRKDMDTDGEWPIRLALVEGTGSGYVELGAVQASDDSPFGVDEQWHSLAAPEVPDGVLEKLTEKAAATKGKGKKAAIDIYRLLRFVGGERGMTQGEIQGALSEGPRTHHRSSVHAALTLLSDAELVMAGSTPGRFVLSE